MLKERLPSKYNGHNRQKIAIQDQLSVGINHRIRNFTSQEKLENSYYAI
jgi:hypothetical protein